MDETVNGHITLDTYLVFDEAKITSENRSLINGKIDVDEYIYRFHKDLWSVSDALRFVQVQRRFFQKCASIKAEGW